MQETFEEACEVGETTFGERLMRAMLALAQRRGRPVRNNEVGRVAGVEGQSVGFWLKDEKHPERHRIAPLARFLGVREAWLLIGDEPMVEPPKEHDLTEHTHARPRQHKKRRES